jgi:hypothetical protein
MLLRELHAHLKVAMVSNASFRCVIVNPDCYLTGQGQDSIKKGEGKKNIEYPFDCAQDKLTGQAI